ncbi:hypothetical protein YTPLAS21_21340 [Candidatus Nitrosocosmicus sp.]|nr:hypothetical protein YTPLAS21_21340 [Candidatus Nitrosocosmicus sp.]
MGQLILSEQVSNLAKDIVAQNSLSPLETVGVIKLIDENEYIVLEGNRRICAYKLLLNPELSPNDKFKRFFRGLSKEVKNLPTEIDCIVFGNRDEADHWIRLRHEGAQNGIGTKEWEPEQKARYAEKRGRKNPNIQATKLIEYATRVGIIDEGIQENKVPVTTVQRYLSNPVVRNSFGLIDGVSLKSKHEPEIFSALIKKFIEDINSGVVNSRTNAKARREYANKLQTQVSPPPPETNDTIDYHNVSSANTGNNTGNKRKRDKRDPAKRKYLIGDNFKLQISNKTLLRIYQEIKKLPVEGHEFSTAYLLRGFLEGTAVQYLKRYDPNYLQKDSRLHNKLEAISKDLKNKGIRDKKLHSLNVAANDKNSLLSPLVLGSMVHLSIIPTKRELIAIWDRFEEIILIIHDYINKP